MKDFHNYREYTNGTLNFLRACFEEKGYTWTKFYPVPVFQ